MVYFFLLRTVSLSQHNNELIPIKLKIMWYMLCRSYLSVIRYYSCDFQWVKDM